MSMRLLSDLFANVPVVVLAAVVFIIALILVFARYFKMPPDFPMKEEYREEVRFRLYNENENFEEKKKQDAEKAAAKEAEEAEERAAKAAAAASAATVETTAAGDGAKT